jgi:hypothetical protein
VLDGGRLVLTGTVDNAGVISLSGATNETLLRFAGPSANLTGGGSIVLGNSLENDLLSQGAACTLTNVDNRISGAGVIGFGAMTLVNDAAGAIVGVGSAGLTINTGTNTLSNAGLIEADKDALTIASAVVNDGKLYALSGTLTLEAAVSGTGLVQINAGTLVAGAAFDERVVFQGGDGVLALAMSTTFTSVVDGFSATGGTSLDLRDIGFVSPSEASFSGTETRGVLTVTDGTHTARIGLFGDFTTSSFVASGDGHGGVTVTAGPASPQAFVGAMAAMGAGTGGSATVATRAHDPLLPMLANTR